MSISSTFFARFFCTNVLFGSFSSYILVLAPKFRTKDARVNVDEIDGRKKNEEGAQLDVDEGASYFFH